MILPIVAYGDPVLRKKASPISFDYPNLGQLINDMYETMYNAKGVGLAAPQIGLSIRLFIVDGAPMNDSESKENDEDLSDFKKIFINPTILSEEGEKWGFAEGCLSIPGIRENINRQSQLTIRYFDENGQEHTETYKGMRARIIQHEYDHIEGVLFTDYLSPLKRQILFSKLQRITKGGIQVEYPMRFPKKK